MKFAIVDIPLFYNAIIGRPILNNYRAIISMVMLCLKMPAVRGIVVAKGSQKSAQDCYKHSTKMISHTSLPFDLLESPKKSCVLELAYEVKETNLEGDRTIRMGTTLCEESYSAMIAVMRKYISTFAWNPTNEKGVDPKAIRNKLNVDPTCKPIKKKKAL